MAIRGTKERQKAFRRGHISEYFAAFLLITRGYRIKAIRYRTKAGEIDIIACRRDLAIFVEVKARARTDDAVFAVSSSAQQRIRSASLIWLSKQADAERLSLRYDIIAVRPWRWPLLIEDAF